MSIIVVIIGAVLNFFIGVVLGFSCVKILNSIIDFPKMMLCIFNKEMIAELIVLLVASAICIELNENVSIGNGSVNNVVFFVNGWHCCNIEQR